MCTGLWPRIPIAGLPLPVEVQEFKFDEEDMTSYVEELTETMRNLCIELVSKIKINDDK